MKDFHFYAPTEVVFGATAEEQTGKLVKKHGGNKVLVHYGGKSAERSGLLDKICKQLDSEGIGYIKLGVLSRIHAFRWYIPASACAANRKSILFWQ